MKILTVASLGLLASTALSLPVAAQESRSASIAETSGDEILVTARRRVEDQQDVPISISALSNEDISSQGIVSQMDLQRTVPGLQLRTAQDRNFFNYAIRGQTVDSYSGSFPGVLSYVNDVQVSAISRATFYDIASIQVLKGPQGTLFGRNTTGGAVLIATAQPTDAFEGHVRAAYGKYNQREIEGVLNVPLSEALQVRLAGNVRRRDGYARNLATGERINNDHSDSFRGSIRWAPAAGITNTTVVDYSRINETSGNILHNVTPCAQGGLADCFYGPANTGQFGFPSYAALLSANPSLPAGGISQRFAERGQSRYWDTYLNVTPRARAKTLVATNTTTIELSDTLRLKNVAGYSSQVLRQEYDTDATDLPLFGYVSTQQYLGADVPLTRSKQFSEELQLQGETPGKELTWIVGGIISKSNFRQSDLFSVFAFPPLFEGLITHNRYQTKDQSIGLFAQATWDAASLAEGLSVTAGVRWTWAKIKHRRIESPFNAPTALLKRSENKPAWTVSLDYKASPDLLFYVANRGSWRTGGFNGNITQVALIPFDAETVVDIEAGMKAEPRLGNVSTQLNIALYKQWVKGTQRLIPVLIDGRTGGITLGVPGGSRVEGVEVAASVSPTDWAKFGVNYAYTKATYPRPNLDIMGVASRVGPYSNTPKHTATFYTQFDIPLGANDETLKLRGDYYLQSESYFSNFGATTQPGSRLAPYGLVNIHAGIENLGAPGLSFGFTMNNVFNEEYATGGIPTGGTLGFETAVPGEPQTFWFDVKYRF